MHELSAVAAIAHRDLVKLLRDRTRLVADLVFPMVIIGVLGVSLQAGFGDVAPFDFLTFVFTGVLAQTVWQSAALGVISLIEDRENDFSQEIFVSPISRYSIVLGKVLGESLVAELGRLGLPVSGDGPYRVELNGRGTHSVLKSIDTPLDMVQTHAPSLEDAYLEIVGRTADEAEPSTDA